MDDVPPACDPFGGPAQAATDPIFVFQSRLSCGRSRVWCLASSFSISLGPANPDKFSCAWQLME